MPRWNFYRGLHHACHLWVYALCHKLNLQILWIILVGIISQSRAPVTLSSILLPGQEFSTTRIINTPSYFTIFEKGQLQSLIPMMEINSFLTGKRGVSLPFTDYSDAIIRDGLSFRDLFDHITEYGKSRRWESVELRGGKIFPRHAASSGIFTRHILNLSKNAVDTFSNFTRSTRRNIRVAVKKGVKVEILHTFDSIQKFHRLNQITRKRHGLPPQPFSFFKKVYEYIISKNLGFVALASYENATIAGAVYFQLGEKAVFKYGTSDKKFQNLRANNLVMWEAIKWYRANGFKSICFGRTEPVNIGLRRFK